VRVRLSQGASSLKPAMSEGPLSPVVVQSDVAREKGALMVSWCSVIVVANRACIAWVLEIGNLFFNLIFKSLIVSCLLVRPQRDHVSSQSPFQAADASRFLYRLLAPRLPRAGGGAQGTGERRSTRRRREFIRNDSQCRKVKRKMRRSWSARASRALQLQKFSGTANGNFDQRRRLRGSAQCRSCKLKRARRLSAILPHMLCRHTCGVPPHMRAGNSVSPQDRRGMSWSAGAQCVLERCRTQPSTGTALYDTFGQR